MTADHGRYGYSAVTQRPSRRWPNGAGLALYVALGVEDYAFGEGRTEDILPGTPQPDLVNTAWRDYGNRVGGFRLLDRLTRYGIRPAVLLNTAVYDTAPPLIAALRASGAEFVAHGQRNSDSLADMGETEERAYIGATSARIAVEEGAPPQGWSSPWLAHSPHSLDLLKEQGFVYLLDLRLDDQPVWLRTRCGPLLAIPYAAELNDSTTMVGRQASARDFAGMIIDEFDEMLAASAEQPLVMSIVVHSFISGQPFRLRALSQALDHILSYRDHLWLTRPGDIAALIARDRERAV
jgi:peptidoglycan/xylan/chitin deacetylase (PgdA/CDA1 family)